MGIQSGAVRKLDVGGTFTTAATATFIFLAGNVRYLPLMSDERADCGAYLPLLSSAPQLADFSSFMRRSTPLCCR